MGNRGGFPYGYEKLVVTLPYDTTVQGACKVMQDNAWLRDIDTLNIEFLDTILDTKK